jgi:hypothetical protein
MVALTGPMLSRKFVVYGRYRKHGSECVCVCVCVSLCHAGERAAVEVDLTELFRARNTNLLPSLQSSRQDSPVLPARPKLLLGNFRH